MFDQSAPIEFFKKKSKALLRSFETGEHEAASRIKAVLQDQSNFGLMKAQHVVAVENGFENWQGLITAPAIELLLIVTMAKVPALNFFGMGVYNQRNLSREDRETEYTKKRDELRKNINSVEQIAYWLQKNVLPIKTINTNFGSYSLKHLAERHLETYVGNGAFIAAAIIIGYPYKTIPGSPNVYFGMSQKSLKELNRYQRKSHFEAASL